MISIQTLRQQPLSQWVILDGDHFTVSPNWHSELNLSDNWRRLLNGLVHSNPQQRYSSPMTALKDVNALAHEQR